MQRMIGKYFLSLLNNHLLEIMVLFTLIVMFLKLHLIVEFVEHSCLMETVIRLIVCLLLNIVVVLLNLKYFQCVSIWKSINLYNIDKYRTGFNQFERLIVTGGASVNHSILQIIADIFQADVFTINVKDSASVGAGIRGYIGYLKTKDPKFSTETFFNERTNDETLKKVASPNFEVKKIYDELLLKYSKIESNL